MSGFHERGDVELCCHLRIFSISGKLAIHIEVDARGDTSEMGNYLSAVPIGGQRERAAVGTHVVVFCGHCWRLLVKVAAPRKSRVHILRVTISVEFPNAWNGHCAPSRVIKVGLEEISRALVGILHPLEFPCAMQRQEVL